MSRIVGIDLGTTNSLVATVDSGIPLVIPGANGERLTPSVVHYPEGGEPIVGQAANRVRTVRPAQTIYSVKRFMGRRGADLSSEEMLVTYAVRGSGGGVAIDVQDVSYSPEQISAEILKKLKGDAEAYFGEPVSRAVITVPAYFNDAQRTATKRAGELAGWTVERILNEPTAAALAYGLDKLKERSKIAVYDFGGGTFDLSILELNEGVFQVLATHGNTRLGGDDLDKRIVDFVVERIRSEAGIDASADLGMMSRIREASEAAKIQLSSIVETEIALPFLTPSYSFRRSFTRSELEDLTRDIIGRTRTHCVRSLADAKIEAKDLDHVILVGGQTRMPLVRKMVAEIFGCAEFEAAAGGVRVGIEPQARRGPLLNTTQNPDEAVALGAAIQAEILAGGFRSVLLLDVTPLSLGLETFGGLMNVIIPRNSTIPTKAGEVFTTAVDHQSSVLIRVLQGEREKAKDNWSLGQFTIEFERAPRGVPRVGVQFEIDADGILHVLARDIKTGRETVVEMKSAVDVEDSKVQEMIEKSVEHAWEDWRVRQWIEAKLRAQETVEASEKAFAEHGAELSGEARTRVEEALGAVQLALGREDSAGVGDLERLKAAHGELDAATQPLADLIMDRAMESVLKRKGLI